jgi:hypothetical protein
MHENVLAAAVADDEPEPLIWVVPLHRADLLTILIAEECRVSPKCYNRGYETSGNRDNSPLPIHGFI